MKSYPLRPKSYSLANPKWILLSVLICSTIFNLSATVTVDINSGNPNFPFPQFLPYSDGESHNLGNLATHNAPGLTHAEMEQTIRDAWQIMANRFIYTGDEYQGVEYIKSNEGAPYDVTEGVGYAMIGAALMGDKTTFDGIWFREHDLRRVHHKKYSDCETTIKPNYRYGKNALVDNTDSATDGDMDMAMGLLIAWKQWGDLSGYTDDCGNPISYKEEALGVIRGLVEFQNSGLGDCRSIAGVIGLDGYFKGGNTWSEMTDWASKQDPCPEFKGGQTQHIDYVSAGYFRAFADFLAKEGGSAEDINWNIQQLKRAQASTAWINGQLLETPTALPLAGWVRVDGEDVRFSSFTDGEDFRHAWRAGMDAMWHSAPSISWDPVSHQYSETANTYEKELALRLARFLDDPTQSPWNNDCKSAMGSNGLTYGGTSQLVQQYDPNTGDALGAFTLNWLQGAASPAAVVAQDYDLMGEMYRQCVIEYNVSDEGDGYLTSTPKYFDGFFRLLGMVILTGNHHSPMTMTKEANMKVYASIDKTVAAVGDEVTYIFSYRNYASVDAEDVVVSCSLPEGLEVVSASNEGKLINGKVEWQIGKVSGFQSARGIASTKGEVTLICKVAADVKGSLITRAEISTSNGQGWISNDYPNNITAVMERNILDVTPNPIKIEKSSITNNNTTITELQFGNTQPTGIINGGRPGVNVACAFDGESDALSRSIKTRLYNNAIEPYIDYGNYRVSLFVNNDEDLNIRNTIYEGGDATDVNFISSQLPVGSNANGSWNTKLLVQFAPMLATTTQHLTQYAGAGRLNVHQGGETPLRAIWQLHQDDFGHVNWEDDWSYNEQALDDDGGRYFPVTNNWSDIYNPDQAVETWHEDACQVSTYAIDNVLVEEWDGYVWRRVAGNAPEMLVDIVDAKVMDKLPENALFYGFIDDKGINVGSSIEVLGAKAQYDLWDHAIVWSKNELKAGEEGVIKYETISGGQTNVDTEAINELKVQPNPAQNAISIAGIDAGANVEIYNMQGVLVKQIDYKQKLDVSSLSQGIYVIKIFGYNDVLIFTKE